jgi:hypothetical protein
MAAFVLRKVDHGAFRERSGDEEGRKVPRHPPIIA